MLRRFVAYSMKCAEIGRRSDFTWNGSFRENSSETILYYLLEMEMVLLILPSGPRPRKTLSTQHSTTFTTRDYLEPVHRTSSREHLSTYKYDDRTYFTILRLRVTRTYPADRQTLYSIAQRKLATLSAREHRSTGAE